MQQKALTEALILESGGNRNKVALSYSTADKARRSVGSDIGQNIKYNFDVHEIATLHWYGKQVSKLADKDQ